jgi:hypothetical protein
MSGRKLYMTLLDQIGRIDRTHVRRTTEFIEFVLRVVLLGIQDGEIERPEDTHGRLKGYAIWQRHITEVHQLSCRSGPLSMLVLI